MFARLTRTAPAFWERPSGIITDLLLPLGTAWDGVGRLRRALSPSYSAPVPVVCIGNLVAGGTGKTPVTIALCSWLLERNVRVHVVSRGYGGRLHGPIRVDRSSHDAPAVGDEALMLAARAPCWVSRDRVAGSSGAPKRHRGTRASERAPSPHEAPERRCGHASPVFGSVDGVARRPLGQVRPDPR